MPSISPLDLVPCTPKRWSNESGLRGRLPPWVCSGPGDSPGLAEAACWTLRSRSPAPISLTLTASDSRSVVGPRAGSRCCSSATNCPDVCPVFLNTRAAAKRALGRGPGSNALVLFVGVDRESDTAKELRICLADVDDSFAGLTGEPDQIDQAINDLQTGPVVIARPGTTVGEEVGHQARVFVFSAVNVSHRLYNHDVSQSQWRKDLPRLAQGQW